MTIGEFSGVTGISVYTLRYYEGKGPIRVIEIVTGDGIIVKMMLNG